MGSLHHLDDRAFFAVNSFAAHSAWLHRPIELYANYGIVLFAALLAVALLRARTGSSRELAAVAWAGLGTLLAVAVNQPLGNWAHEPRPYRTYPHVFLLAQRSSDFSFPSDHAVMAGAVAAGLLIAWRRLGLVAVGLAVLMAFARVYIAAHYPWDVVVGLLVGAAVVGVGWLVLQRPLVVVADRLRGVPPFRAVFVARTHGHGAAGGAREAEG